MILDLNTEQTEAVLHVNGPLLVVAGAGSGKTRALTHRIAYLVSQGIRPWNILAVTFTNKAAGEMKSRIHSLLPEMSEPPLIGTFHSLGVRILRNEFDNIGRNRSFSILDSDDSLSLIKRLQKELGISDKEYHPRAIAGKISSLKNTLQTSQFLSHTYSSFDRAAAEILKRYEKEKIQMNALDFDDLILLPVQLFEEHPDILQKYRKRWQYVSVDEFQDTNPVQFRFLDLLTAEHRNLCVIGDSDQSIYAFRGADIRNILDFQKNFPEAKVIRLEENYRSMQSILEAADGLIEKNENRVPKKMRANRSGGEKVSLLLCKDEREEANKISEMILDERKKNGRKLSDFAVLVRTNAQTRPLEESFLRHAIPYQIIGGLKFYSRKEVKDILAYLRFLENPADSESLLRIINLPPRKIGGTTLVRLMQHSQERNISLQAVLEHIEFADGLSPAAKKAIDQFASNIKTLRQEKNFKSPSDIIGDIIETFGFEKFYRDGTEEGEGRYENILEMKSVARKFDGIETGSALALFLEEVALIADIDTVNENDRNRVLLMTLHSSKGLEFPVVFLPGLEEGLLPHSRSLFDPNALEEERRLMYVGMTRAMDKLVLLHANSRMLYGNTEWNSESRFIHEIPSTCIEEQNTLLSSHFSVTPQKNPSFSFSSYANAQHLSEPRYIPEYAPGDSVAHDTFGVGTISNIEGDLADILFQKVGKKRIALSFAPMKKNE